MGRGPQLSGQTVLVIGGSSGIGLETARRAHGEGADVILTARDPDRVHRAGLELEARIAAFDATDFERLGRFFVELPPIDHVMVTGPRSQEMSHAGFDVEAARRDVDAHLLLPLRIGVVAGAAVRPKGSILFMGCIARDGTTSPTFVSALTQALSVMAKRMASELAPTRVNVIAAGSVDVPTEPVLDLGLGATREDPRSKRPLRGVVSVDAVAALAIHLMTNSAVTGATFEIDGGQRLVRP